MEDISYWMLFCGLASILMSSAVLITFSCFPTLRKYEYNYVIVYIAFSDLCAGIGIAIGLQNSGSIGCDIQTLLTHICPLWSIFWTTVIALYVVRLATSSHGRDEPPKIPLLTHYIVWISPIILNLLILTTNTYGCPYQSTKCWCFVGELNISSEQTTKLWYLVSNFDFILYYLICICIYICNYLLIIAISCRYHFTFGYVLHLLSILVLLSTVC